LTLARTLLDSWIGRGSASGVGAVLVLALFGGCAWSPDITVRNEKDEPPIIDRSLVKPSPDSPDQPFLLHGLQSFTVEGAVTDPDDPVETLDYYWFIKGDLLTKKKAQFITFDPCRQDLDLVFGDSYMLELFVVDGEIELDPEEGRTVNGGYAYVSWWLQMDTTCGPQ
jgi:hypothetical protein